ncbi:MAG: hypothetical protein AAGI37_20710 [Planctomycetota bacterium]
MRPLPSYACLVLCLACSFPAAAQYTEVMDPDGLTLNAVDDFDLTDDGGATNQSSEMQAAIDGLSAEGGGRLILPKGVYRFSGIYMRSNVHLLVEAGTIIKPYWPVDTKVVVFNLDAERPANRKAARQAERDYIENVSIRGLGGRFTIDYSDRSRKSSEGSRGVLVRMARNFLIADLDVQDNFTVFCGITLTASRSKAEDVSDWEVSRATDGTIRNCRIFNASPGYGMVQLHGARRVHFEDLYAKGGVTLRLETGALNEHTAVHDITAKNIVGQDGRCAVMFGPHSAVNGKVTIENVKSIGCTYAVLIEYGSIKKQELAKDPETKPGKFADGSSVSNIHAVFGKHAQIKSHHILEIPEPYLKDLWLRWENKFFDGPSIGAVKDGSRGTYHIRCENITLEGFTHNSDKPILGPEDAREGKWPIALKAWMQREDVPAAKKQSRLE